MTTYGAPDTLTRLGAHTSSTVITPSLITQQISVEKCMHRGTIACRERQTMFKIVTWTKQSWTKHHNTFPSLPFIQVQHYSNNSIQDYMCNFTHTKVKLVRKENVVEMYVMMTLLAVFLNIWDML